MYCFFKGEQKSAEKRQAVDCCGKGGGKGI